MSDVTEGMAGQPAGLGGDERPDERRAVVLDSDLFFVAKVGATLKHLGFAVETARSADDLARRFAAHPFTLALVNTAARGVDWQAGIATARANGAPTIAYGAHVDVEAQAQARAAGATRVIANSKLASDLPRIVEQTLQRAASASATDTTDAEEETAPGEDA